MGINWIRIEDEFPKDNGHIQKLLVCTNMKVSSFGNCDITTCYFTDRFRKEDSNIPAHVKITHWAKIEKPDDLKLYVNTEDEKDVVTLEEIKRRYTDIQGTSEDFEEYVTSGFMDGITTEYREL